MQSKKLIIIAFLFNVYIPLFIAYLITQSMLATSFSSSNITVDGDTKQTINFYGKLITHQGQEDLIENISIGGKIKDIIMYDSPAKHPEAILDSKTKQLEIKLNENPTTDFVKSKIDLNKTSKMYIPNPNTIWFYQKEDKYKRQEFTQIFITPEGSDLAKPYLLEHKTHIFCNTVDNGTEQKKEVPLAAVQNLIIEGHSFNATDKKQDKNKSCPTQEKSSK